MLDDLIQISRRYGADPAFVLAGGGNTSLKQGDRLWVKASGHALSTIDEKGFVELDRIKLDAMLNGTWPADPAERESAFIAAVMAARVHPELNQRPSVEALLHHLLPATLVVHTHPGAINAVTCCVRGPQLTRDWFGDRVLWQPYVDPGLILAQKLAASLKAHIQRAGSAPDAIFLANHGLIVSGESAEAVEKTTAELLMPIHQQLNKTPASQAGGNANGEAILRMYSQALVVIKTNLTPAIDCSPAIMALVATSSGRDAAMAGPLSPDQIVYCRSIPLWSESPVDHPGQAARDWETAFSAYIAQHGVEPWVALLNGVGLIALRTSAALSEITRAVYADAAGVYRDAAALGGVHVLDTRDRRFIEEWEVEAYRRAVMK